jgi:fucose 4-O-acetylase-like acetyltransferase
MRAARWAGYGDGRVTTLDVGRGLAIVSVIYGHALAPWFMAAGERFSEPAFLQWKFGASFMMVFFFFLSGVGWRAEKAFTVTLRQSISLVLIAWLASVVFDAGRLLVGWSGFATAPGEPALDLMSFLRGAARMGVVGDQYSLTALWFLAALAIVRVLAAIVVRAGPLVTVLATLALLALTLTSTSLGWRNIYQLNLIGVAFAAFIVGHALSAGVRALERSVLAALAVLTVCGAATALTFDLNDGCLWDVTGHCGQDWLNDGFGVSMFSGQYGNLPLFFFTAAVGTGFAMALCILIARQNGLVGRRLEAWGRNSLNLLIVNSLFLHVANPLIEHWIVPRVDGVGWFFFVALFTVTFAANLIVTRALTRPLRRLTSLASRISAEAIDLVRRIASWAIVATRGHRVSQEHE